ncbi:hypothetical protein [Streptomyces sp. E-08]|uniref:hypothetical protein n=1 Tax=Streptomyces sp. E-08 TaxID=3404047 RepID=UPI003CECCA1E
MTATRCDRRMYAVMNDRRAAAYATATRRRLLVGAHVALTATGVGGGVGAYGVLTDAPLRAAVTPVLVGVLAVHWMMPLWVAGLRVQDDLGDDAGDES